MLTAKSTPTFFAISKRKSDISLIKTFSAPKALTEWANKIPIGPAPITTTLEPFILEIF